ncbi:MAG: 3-methyladenine DNA glycosylase 2, partial [Rhodocyclaceae bacterium]
AAVSLRRRLIVAAGLRHASGLYCYPQAAQVAALGEEALRAAGYSSAKTRALLGVAEAVGQGSLPLEEWADAVPDLAMDDIAARLLALRGIGPWTVSYALLRGFGWLDGSLHGDVAVRRGLQKLLGSEDKLGEEATRQWLADFSPWRALLAAHLWAFLSAKAY